MATINDQKYATQYTGECEFKTCLPSARRSACSQDPSSDCLFHSTGLISTASLALGFITIFTVAFETFSRLPRNIARKKRRQGGVNVVDNNNNADDAQQKQDEESVEDYLMAYLYRPRQFLGVNRPPPLPKWPFAWVWQVLRLSQDWYLRHSGLDAAVYIRFVTGCWYFMLSQLCTTLIITLPLHITYAPESVLPSSIAQASVNSLITSTTGGRSYLWVRTVLLWWQSICWIAVVIYVGWGNIRMRREQVLYPWTDMRDGGAKDSESALKLVDHTGSSGDRPEGIDTRGWRFRTVKVSNIPARRSSLPPSFWQPPSQAMLTFLDSVFNHPRSVYSFPSSACRLSTASLSHSSSLDMRNEAAIRNYLDTCLTFLKSHPTMRFYKPPLPSRPSSGGSPAQPGNTTPASPAIGAPYEGETTIDHIVIIRKLTELHGLVKKRREVLHELESAHVGLAREVMAAVAARIREQAHQRTLKEKIHDIRPKRKSTKELKDRRDENIDMLVEALGSYLPVDSKEAELWKEQNLEKRQMEDSSVKTIWQALAELPQEALDAYQPVTKLKFFRGQIAPSIDLYLTKLNLLTVSMLSHTHELTSAYRLTTSPIAYSHS